MIDISSLSKLLGSTMLRWEHRQGDGKKSIFILGYWGAGTPQDRRAIPVRKHLRVLLDQRIKLVPGPLLEGQMLDSRVIKGIATTRAPDFLNAL